MKKKLLFAVIALLCLAMTVPMTLTALFAAKDANVIHTIPANTDRLSTSSLVSLEDFITGTPSNTFDLSKNVSITGKHQLTTRLKVGFTYFQAMGNDPYGYIKSGSQFVAGRFILITYRTDNAENCDLQFYIGSAGTGPADDSGMMRQPVVADGEWHTAFFDTATLPNTSFNGKTGTYFRLDPLDGASAKSKSIDIKKIEFYNDDAIDYNAYLEYLEQEEAKKSEVDWADPEYVEMETVADDHYDGTLTYTPSDDASQMTISYEVNGKTVSYTVPNKNNYLFGGFAGTDDLGRELYTSTDIRNEDTGATIGVYGENGERYVGLFYFLWLGEHKVGDDGIYNLQEIIDSNDPADYISKLGPGEAHHFYAEPLYGYYYSKDKWVMKKHAELLCNAGIDFLYLDATNALPYLSNALQLMSVLDELNQQGYDAPQIVFYTNSSSNAVIKNIYESVYEPELYKDTWFRIDGKPVIVGTESTDNRYGRPWNGPIEQKHKDFFYIKEAQWPNEQAKGDAWPWMDFQWPQTVYTNADGQLSAINVSVAQHSTTVAFGTSALQAPANPSWGGVKINRGRSFNARNSAPVTLQDYHTAWLTDPGLTKLGLNFQAQWDRAHSYSEKDQLEFVLVTGWNEWVAQYQKGTDALFIDCASMEFSRDTEMMAFYDSNGDGADDGYFDNYYMQLVQNVERLKGDAPVIVQDGRLPINVTGSFDQWDNVTVTYTDPKGDCGDRNSPGFGGQIYLDTSGRNDIVGSKIVNDTKNIYFYAQTRYDVSKYDKISSWMQLFIDIDDDASTGWYGYDYIVNYRAKGDFVTTVAKYNGENGNYRFIAIGDVSYRAKDNELMVAVPLEMLGIEDYEEMCFQFKWADSETKITTMQQFYTEGDAAPLGRLNYVFQNYIPGAENVPEDTDTETDSETESDITSDTKTETETETDTEVGTETNSDTQTETEADTETETETVASDKGGCASVISAGSALVVTAVVTAVVLKKKKED